MEKGEKRITWMLWDANQVNKPSHECILSAGTPLLSTRIIWVCVVPKKGEMYQARDPPVLTKRFRVFNFKFTVLGGLTRGNLSSAMRIFNMTLKAILLAFKAKL